MGWVTLALRKAELKRSHSDYTSRLLGISRTKRTMAREKTFESNSIQAQKQEELRRLKFKFDATSASENASLQTELERCENGQDSKDTLAIKYAIEQTKLLYEQQKADVISKYDDKLEFVELDATDKETYLDQEQVEVETQLEVISQEMQAVSQAISNQIQNSTIKLS